MSKTAKHRITQTMLYDCPWTVVCWCQRSQIQWNFNSVTLNRSAK